jgi:FKBP-type peptidyl-prolyl cis-trans isomerase
MMLSEGDSAIIKTNIDSASHGQKRNPTLKGQYIIYTIKVEKVIPKGNLTDEVFQGRYKDYLKKLGDADKNAEAGKIKKYIDDNNLKLTKTVTGLNYVINTPGQGALPAPGDTVVVNYLGKFVNGKVFDTNIKAEAIKAKLQINPMNPYKAIRFPVGAQGMIQGFSEGLLLMNKGAKATFIIPSSLAYGEQGNGPVAPFTPLVFDLELVDIVHPNPNAPKPAAVMPPAQSPVKR